MDRATRRGGLGLATLLVHPLVLALVLGAATFAGWLLLGRRAFQGGIPHAINDNGLLLFGALALAWALVGLAAGRWSWRSLGIGSVALLILLAWLAQGLMVVVFGQVLAGELRTIPFRAAVWLTATGAVLQPTAVLIGAWVGQAPGRGSGRRPSAPC